MTPSESMLCGAMAPPTLFAQLATPEGHVAATLARLADLDHELVPSAVDRDGPPRRVSGTEPAPTASVVWVDADRRREGDEALRWLEGAAGGRVDRAGGADLRTELFVPVETVHATEDQAVYEQACRAYFATLARLDEDLAARRFLGGPAPKLADLWLFAALVRHDPAYVPFFKLTLARLDDFDHLGGYARDMFQLPGFSDLVRLREIRRHYAWRSEATNPKRRVPIGGLPDLWRPHPRHRRFDTRPRSDAGAQESQQQVGAVGWVRPASAHRAWVEASPTAEHPLEDGRYHLYVSHNCPWSHRVTLGRAVLGLEAAIGLDVAFYRRDPDRGWQFRPEEPGCTPDTVHGSRYIKEIYEREDSKEKSVPILYDKALGRVVNNESSEILRMLHTTFRPLARRPLELCPPELEIEIDLLNQWIYQRINNGAYKAGFSSAQEAYDEAADAFFDALEGLEAHLHLQSGPFLLGSRLTEPDLRLFPTLFRFDDVYFTRFLLNRRKLDAYPRLSAWREAMLQVEGVRAASRLDHCKKGYFGRTGNRLVPLTPEGL